MNNHSQSNDRDRAEGTTLSGERLQRFENAANAYREFAERWNNEAIRRQKLFSEYYAEGNAALIYQLELSLRTSKEVGAARSEFPANDSVFSAFVILHKNMVKNDFVNMWNQEMVFVLDVELMEGKQKSTAPCLVWLDNIDNSIKLCSTVHTVTTRRQ